MRFTDISRVRSSFDERVTARDGVELSADVYWPAEQGTYPVLVTRTPYDNNHADQSPPTSTSPHVPSDLFKLIAAHGFIVVAGDVRGRGDSEGAFVPFVHEAMDGEDVLQWARSLPESNGRLGVFGTGYAGFAALAVADKPGVDAVAAWSPFGAGMGLPARGGALRLDWLLWLHLVGGRVRGPVDVPAWSEIFRSRPLARMHEVLGRADSVWPEWLGHLDPDDAFWSSLDLDHVLAAAQAPTLLVSGWWDVSLEATLKHWGAATTSAEGSRHRLVVGPWDSAAVRRPTPDVGGVAWGPGSAIDPAELLLAWFDAHLHRDSVVESPGLTGGLISLAPTAHDAPAGLFVTGRNAWTTTADWADARATESLWLSSGGAANTRVGDGRLLTTTAADDAADRFVHDPTNPVPWQPGDGSFARSRASTFTLGSSFATSRDDALVYSSAPAVAPRLIRGRPVVHLWAVTDLDDADWVVALEDVFPGDTRSVHLSHGIVRAATLPHFTANQIINLTIAMTPLAHELQPGHALRLVVASSLFPLYAVNVGSVDYIGSASAGTYGTHAVHHGPSRPSRLDLPGAPAS